MMTTVANMENPIARSGAIRYQAIAAHLLIKDGSLTAKKLEEYANNLPEVIELGLKAKYCSCISAIRKLDSLGGIKSYKVGKSQQHIVFEATEHFKTIYERFTKKEMNTPEGVIMLQNIILNMSAKQAGCAI